MMNMGDHGWNKLKEWQRQKSYKQHMQRMKIISSPAKRKRSIQQQTLSRASGPDLQYMRNGHKIQQQRRMDLENHRLLKKLDEIGKRRHHFNKQTLQQKKYYTINLKSREASRRIKNQQIQQENDLIVERIIKMRSRKGLQAQGLLHDASIESLQRKSNKKSRIKRKNTSLILPKIDGQVQNHEPK